MNPQECKTESSKQMFIMIFGINSIKAKFKSLKIAGKKPKGHVSTYSDAQPFA